MRPKESTNSLSVQNEQTKVHKWQDNFSSLKALSDQFVSLILPCNLFSFRFPLLFLFLFAENIVITSSLTADIPSDTTYIKSSERCTSINIYNRLYTHYVHARIIARAIKK